MMVYSEQNLNIILHKMTEIKRKATKTITHNYYLNITEDRNIFAVYEEHSLVFWYHDLDVTRGFFYTSDLDECKQLLKCLPAGSILEYISKDSSLVNDFLISNSFCLISEMQRMKELKSEKNKSPNEKFWEKYSRFYDEKSVRLATMGDAAVLYDKMHSVFDVRESHLPSMEYLQTLIKDKMVVVYFKNNELLAFYLFVISPKGQFYGYQIWSGTGIEGLISLEMKGREVFNDFVKQNKIDIEKIPPAYAWVNVKNKAAIKLSLLRGRKPDGLKTYIYEKERDL